MAGDYTLQFGQGLTLWSGFSFDKGPDVTSVAKKDLGLRPYTSTNEYSFFRGAAATINLYQHFDLTPFVSIRHLDASQKADKAGDLVQSTINQTGLHRTPTEIKNKGSLTQRVYGLAYSTLKTSLVQVPLLIKVGTITVLSPKQRFTINTALRAIN